MGLDTHIYKVIGYDQTEIGYLRKVYEVAEYWEDFAKRNFPNLSNGLDFNCIMIPINKESWEKFLNYFFVRYISSKKKPKEYILEAHTELTLVDNYIKENNLFKNGGLIHVLNWY